MRLAKTLTLTLVTIGVMTLSASAFAADVKGAPQNFTEQETANVGQPRGFENGTEFTSIADVLKKSHDHDKVVVRGKLTKFIGGEKYQLTDENNDNIVVELDDDKDWSYLAKDMPIVVFAEVDNDHMTKILEVKKARPDRGAMPFGQGGPRGHAGQNGHRPPMPGMHGPQGAQNCPVCPVCPNTEGTAQ